MEALPRMIQLGCRMHITIPNIPTQHAAQPTTRRTKSPAIPHNAPPLLPHAQPALSHTPSAIPDVVQPAAPTLAEVAKAAGVSIATASRVINSSAPVSNAARQQVREAAIRLGYVRQRAAPARPRTRIRAVVAVACTNQTRLFADPFYARLINSASDVFAAHDIPLIVLAATDERMPTVERYLHSGQLDGVLLLADHGRYPLSASLAASGRPVVMVGRPLRPARLSYVDADNRGGAAEAVRYLIGQGRRSIVTIAGPPDMAVGADRLAGYRDAVAGAKLAETGIAYGDWSHASGVHAMWRLLDQRPGLDAVFVASDMMAAGALHALHRAGRRIPEDVAVVGFDDLVLAQQTRPPLTTVRQPIEQFGTVAAQHLMAAMNGEERDEVTVLPTTLVARASA
jgi:DNA-binding LacI/PurR family transcriptional regulator